MKKVLGVLMISGVCYSAQSQKIYVQGGVNLANITKTDEGHTEKNNMLTTFNAGLMVRFKATSMFGIETGLLLTGRGSKADTYFGAVIDPDVVYRVKSTFNPLYLEVPFNLIVNIPGGTGPSFFVNAGPYIAMGVGGKSKVTTYGSFVGTVEWERKIDFTNDDPLVFEEEEATYNRLKKFDYGFNLGGGINFKKLIIKANYGFGLTSIDATASMNNGSDKNKYRTVSFSVGIPLGL